MCPSQYKISVLKSVFVNSVTLALGNCNYMAKQVFFTPKPPRLIGLYFTSLVNNERRTQTTYTEEFIVIYSITQALGISAILWTI